MCSVRFTLSAHYRSAVERQLQTAQPLGHLRQVKFLLALLAVMDGQSVAAVALVLRLHEQTVAAWVCLCCCDGLKGAPRKTPTGRPPKLTPTHKAARAMLLDEGPVKAGCSGAGWRSPMIQPFIDDRCGVFDQVFYLAQWLKTLGLSDQNAAFVSAHLDAGQRNGWCTTTWPQMLRRTNERKALRLCGDEASFPPWGTLTYTWARRGQQPKVKTAGQRKGDQVFGWIESCTGRLFDQGQEGRLNSAASLTFLTRVLAHTTQDMVLIQDGATYQTSAETNAFFAQQTARLQVFQLPTDSPDDHPIEKLWQKLTQQATHVPYFPTLEALTEQVEQALLTFAHAPAEVLALCRLPTEWAKVASERFLKQSFS